MNSLPKKALAALLAMLMTFSVCLLPAFAEEEPKPFEAVAENCQWLKSCYWTEPDYMEINTGVFLCMMEFCENVGGVTEDFCLKWMDEAGNAFPLPREEIVIDSDQSSLVIFFECPYTEATGICIESGSLTDTAGQPVGTIVCPANATYFQWYGVGHIPRITKSGLGRNVNYTLSDIPSPLVNRLTYTFTDGEGNEIVSDLITDTNQTLLDKDFSGEVDITLIIYLNDRIFYDTHITAVSRAEEYFSVLGESLLVGPGYLVASLMLPLIVPVLGSFLTPFAMVGSVCLGIVEVVAALFDISL